MKFPIPVSAVVLCLVSAAAALDVRFLAWDDPVANRKLAVLSGGEAKEIANLHPLQRSENITTTAAEGGIRIRALDRKTAEGKAVDFPVKVAAGISKPLILLLPDAKAPSGIRGLAIEDSSGSFPWGSFRMLNATGKDLACGIGKQGKMIPAGWKPVDMKPAGDKPVSVWFALPVKPVKPFYSAVWPLDPDKRRLVILIPGTDPRLGPLTLKVIPEDRPEEPGTAP